MSFKYFGIIGLLLFSQLKAAQIENYPLGIILRPSLVQRFFNQMNSEEKGIPIDACISEKLGLRIIGSAQPKFSKPRWDNASSDSLFLSASIDQINLSADILGHCSKGVDESRIQKESFGKIHISIKESVKLSYIIYPWDLHVHHNQNESQGSNIVELSEDSINKLSQSLEIKLEPATELTKDLNSSQSKRVLVKSIASIVNKRFTKWLETRLRGLVYFGRLSKMFENEEVWKQGVQIEKGAISLANPGERLRQSELIFGFYPRADQFVILGDGALELYFNSMFLDKNGVSEILKGEAKTQSEEKKLQLIKDRFIFDPPVSDAPFSRPLISRNNTDVSLILPETLINGALRHYQQDLKQFTTTIGFGQQARSLITENAVDVSLRIELESDSAPRIFFHSNQLSLSVTNYFLSIGTLIEDRLIPSTQVKAEVNVNATLNIRGATVNLAVKPDTFKMELEKGRRFRNQLSDGDLSLIEDVSNELWRDFFNKYPELPLFYTIFNTPDSRIKIQGLDVDSKIVILHFDFEEIRMGL